ncbi:FIST C-terminal domain-containing protein, partial [Leptolyngbya sp. FACHB-36]|uniref:FIST signal transduction protein n=1 Tax=Leptolyngbya sp. FACHB-36 TaxID=2692808 RepID=UPI0016806C34
QQAQAALPTRADLGLVFISSAFASEYSRLMPLLQARLPGLPLIGCAGGGIIGTPIGSPAQEVEGEAALSLTLAALPGVTVHTFHLDADELPDLDSSPDAWIRLIGVDPESQPHFVLLADPFSTRLNDLLQGIDFAYPGSLKVGGLASGGSGSGRSAVFQNYSLYRSGTVGVALSGNIVVETIVAQGCRPIGQPYVVTESERNILLGLEAFVPSTDATSSSCSVADRQTPLEVLRDLIQSLSEEDRMLAQNFLFIGIAQSAFKQTLEPGDFLIRTLLGVDPNAGAIAIGDRIRPGQRIQFHLRDAQASAEDLEVLLERYRQTDVASPAGALMFSCLGRGEGLYGEPNFDSRLFHRYLARVPLSGFFCDGEIGPVGSSTFLHGFTSVFGMFRQRTD